MKRFVMVGFLAAIVGLNGCSLFSETPVKAASTSVVYKHDAVGNREVSYQSDKEQVGLDVDYEGNENGTIKKVHIKADRSGTPEGFLAAQVEALKIQAQMIKDLMEQIKAMAASGGAGS